MSRKPGKIEQQFFEEYIRNKCGRVRPEVSIGPQFGTDVSIIDLPGGMAMALTSDPLSLVPLLGLKESAWLSVQLMVNDMATTGFAPMYGQFVLNLPASFPKNDFRIYWEHIHQFCADTGIAITGGHTCFIEGQNSTIAGGGTLITIAAKDKMLVSSFAQAGDSILVTKESAILSAAILAMCFPETVKNKAGAEIYQLACQSFYQTSSLQDALAAADEKNEHRDVTAMHDVTEGGVLGAIYELAIASHNGAVIYNQQIPVGEVQKKVCDAFALDPRYCVGAGAMIITCKKGTAPEVIARLKRKNIVCVEVGELREKAEGIKIMEDGREKDLVYAETDPYWAAFFNAYNAGWK